MESEELKLFASSEREDKTDGFVFECRRSSEKGWTNLTLACWPRARSPSVDAFVAPQVASMVLAATPASCASLKPAESFHQ